MIREPIVTFKTVAQAYPSCFQTINTFWVMRVQPHTNFNARFCTKIDQKIYIIFDFYEHTTLGIYIQVVNMNDSDHNALHRG